MKVGKMVRVALALALAIAALVAVGLVFAADTPPTVDGAFYSTGDSLNYDYAGEALLGNAIMWDHIEYSGTTPMTYYVAVEVAAGYVDNVFDRSDNGGLRYLTDVGWESSHTFEQLFVSDGLGEEGLDEYIRFTCGDTQSWQWQQDLIYAPGNPGQGYACEVDPYTCDWTSPIVEGTIAPPGIQTASSLQWNMLNAIGLGSTDLWTVTVTEGGQTDNWEYWKSPDWISPTDSTDSSPLDYGYGSGWYDPRSGWEWLIIYEMAIPVGDCQWSPEDWEFGVDEAHASPEKAGWTGCSGDITIVKDVICVDECDPGTDFDFTTGGLLSPTSFTLDDLAGDDLITNTQYFGNLASGTYTVTEIVTDTDDWELVNIECQSQDYGDGGLVQFGNGVFDDLFDEGTDDSVRIDLRTCESLVCTFTNEYDPGTTSVGLSSFAAKAQGGNALLLALGGLVIAAAGLVWVRRRND